MDQTDLDLIQAHRRGDGFAMEELIRRHLPRVRNLAFQMVLNNDIADDLSQDVFARVLRGLERFRGQSSFVTWLHRITINVAYDFLRTPDHRSTSELPEEFAESGAASPEDGIIAAEKRDRIASALSKLPPTLRAAIALTVMQGLSAAEAAELEECSVGTMYWRIHEARRHLRNDLKDWIE